MSLLVKPSQLCDEPSIEDNDTCGVDGGERFGLGGGALDFWLLLRRSSVPYQMDVGPRVDLADGEIWNR